MHKNSLNLVNSSSGSSKTSKSSKSSRSKSSSGSSNASTKKEKRSSTLKTMTKKNPNTIGELGFLRDDSVTIEAMMTASLGSFESEEPLTRAQNCRRCCVGVPWATGIGVLLLIVASITGHIFIIRAHRYTVINFGKNVSALMSEESKAELKIFSDLLGSINTMVQAAFCLAYIISPATLIIAILSSGHTRLVFGKHMRGAKAALTLLICMQIILFLLYTTFVVAEACMGVHVGLFYAMESACMYSRDSLEDVSRNPMVKELLDKYTKLARIVAAITDKKSPLPELKSDCIAGVLCIDIKDLELVCNNFMNGASVSVYLAVCVIICMLGLAIILAASGSNFVWLIEVEKEFYFHQARKKFEADLERSGYLHNARK